MDTLIPFTTVPKLVFGYVSSYACAALNWRPVPATVAPPALVSTERDRKIKMRMRAIETPAWCLLAGALLLASGAWAQNTGPAGLWKTVDGVSGKAKALVRISESNGEFTGKIEKLFLEKNADPAPLCTPCKGSKKDQPVIGMTILDGLKVDGSGYSGGNLLDPEVGKVYKGR
jgi:uncharacterized protein (DUF2147 family)